VGAVVGGGRGGEGEVHAVAEVEGDLARLVGVVVVGGGRGAWGRGDPEGLEGADGVRFVCGGEARGGVGGGGGGLALADLVDEVPRAPGLHGVVPGVCDVLVVGAEEVHEVLGAEEHGRLLLALDRVAVALRRLQLAQLRRRGIVDVEVGEVADRHGVLGRGVARGLAADEDLPRGKEGDVAFDPAAWFLRMVHLHGGGPGPLLGGVGGDDIEVVLRGIGGLENERVLRVAVPGVHDVADVLVAPDAPFQAGIGVGFEEDGGVGRDGVGEDVGGGVD